MDEQEQIQYKIVPKQTEEHKMHVNILFLHKLSRQNKHAFLYVTSLNGCLK